MSWLDGMTKNWAELAPDAQDSRLRPIVLPVPRAEAVRIAAEAIARRPRWEVLSADPETGTIHATHKTLVWQFIDDVHIRFEPEGPGTRVTAESRSRIGKADLGQNARNLRDLVSTLAGIGAEAEGTEEE
ncbi:hypothetical protein BH23PLA1_BH23PLA1_05740 [soil metagenome]